MNAGNDNVQCFPLSRDRRPKEINCCLVLSLNVCVAGGGGGGSWVDDEGRGGLIPQ